MRGALGNKKLKSGKLSHYIDYYPPVWNPQAKQYYVNCYLQANTLRD